MMRQERTYSSFEEIIRDKEICKVQMQVNEHKIKRSAFYIKESLSPVNIGASIALNILQKRFVNKLLAKLFPFRRY